LTDKCQGEVVVVQATKTHGERKVSLHLFLNLGTLDGK